MRLRRLDLIRYGRFTDKSLEMPPAKRDICIIYGANEAGKSTSLSAIEDLFFGIPSKSSLNFLHDYKTMRVGGVLTENDQSLEMRRRKGTKSTLMTPEDQPMAGAEAQLTQLLTGADREFYLRMFSLDYRRLHEGGQEILKEGGGSGQTLFAASAGLLGLRECMAGLEEEANELWSPRKAKTRKYYQADERRAAADKELAERTVLANNWHKLKSAYKVAREKEEAFQSQIESMTVEQRKLSRIRRVYRDVQKERQYAQELQQLGTVVALPDNARTRLLQAELLDGGERTRIETLNEQLASVQIQLSELSFDNLLLACAAEVQALHERRIRVVAGQDDLPKRRSELATTEKALRALANDVGWTEVATQQLPTRFAGLTNTRAVRELFRRGASLRSEQQSADARLRDAQRQLTARSEELAEVGEALDVSILAALVQTHRARAQSVGHSSLLEQELASAQDSIVRGLTRLKPSVQDAGLLDTMQPPAAVIVGRIRDLRLELNRSLQDCLANLRRTEQDIARTEQAQAQVVKNEKVVTVEELMVARARRDTGWSLIKRQYIAGENVPSEESAAFVASNGNLANGFEGAVGVADNLADNRFERAKAAARVAELGRKLDQERSGLAEYRCQQQALEERSQKLDEEWQRLWMPTGLIPLCADDMLQWLSIREEVLTQVQRRNTSQRQLDSLLKEQAEAKVQLLAQLHCSAESQTPEALASQSLAVLLEAAASRVSQGEQQEQRIADLDRAQRQAREEVATRQQSAAASAVQWQAWKVEGDKALSSLNLSGAENFSQVNVKLGSIDEMRELSVKVSELRHERIEKIERDTMAFGEAMAELAGRVASDLNAEDPTRASLELDLRLEGAIHKRELAREKQLTVERIEKKIQQVQDSRQAALETLRELKALAGVNSVEDLREAIGKSEEQRRLQLAHNNSVATLEKEGDGFGVEELRVECLNANLDQAAAAEERLNSDLKALQARSLEARSSTTMARQALDEVGQGDGAAIASAKREAALAEMGESAEQYVKVRTASLLLHWAIERFRRDKQAPLLSRASELFATLTASSFQLLQPQYNEDEVEIVGVRQDETSVSLPAMSTGTADQLYLALRIASVEDYLERASGLPFLADDLFINFDDERAEAGFAVLGELAEKTQVLFFTHHQHLVDVAKRALGSEVPVLRLDS